MSAKDIVNMAESVWKIIDSGRPSSEINGKTANAVPQVDDWQALQSPKGPKNWWANPHRRVSWPFDDYVTVDCWIYLKWEYGATYKGGGAYIPNIWIEVPQCYVGWKSSLDVDLRVHNPTNDGTDTAPIARVPISVSGTLTNPLRSDRIEYSLIIWGNGNWRYS
jgi:hypothetical protein